MPMEQGKVILLPVDGEYNLCFYTQSGLYQCLARVIDRYKSDNIFVLVMELTTDIRKYQRREYYRLNCVLDMKARNVTPSDKGRYRGNNQYPPYWSELKEVFKTCNAAMQGKQDFLA